MNVYECILMGFDGGTDETDNLIKWVEAPNMRCAADLCIKNDWDWANIELLRGVDAHRTDIDAKF